MNVFKRFWTGCTFRILALVVVPMLGAGCQHGAVAVADSAAQGVAIGNFAFTPATLNVKVGTTVTWVNHDDVPHTVTADDKRFSSQALDTDDHFSHRFDAPGTYPYFCAVHPHMTGRIIVK